MYALSLENTEFEGHNNAYLLDNGTTLIDTGIVLTHWHPDHAGLAETVQRESRGSL